MIRPAHSRVCVASPPALALPLIDHLPAIASDAPTDHRLPIMPPRLSCSSRRCTVAVACSRRSSMLEPGVASILPAVHRSWRRLFVTPSNRRSPPPLRFITFRCWLVGRSRAREGPDSVLSMASLNFGVVIFSRLSRSQKRALRVHGRTTRKKKKRREEKRRISPQLIFFVPSLWPARGLRALAQGVRYAKRIFAFDSGDATVYML